MTHRLVPSLLALACVSTFVSAGCSAQHRANGAAGFSGSEGGKWAAPIARDHPLVGSVFEVAGGRVVPRGELFAALAAADIVLLGEQHDNVDHHRLQDRLLREMLEDGRRPTLAFEQLDVEDQGAVDRVLAARGADDDPAALATGLAQAVDWPRSGWPPFDEYRALFETAIGAGLPIRAANLSRKAMSHVLAHTTPAQAGVKATKAAGTKQAATAAGTTQAASATETGKTVAAPDASRDVVLSESARAALAAEIEESHCGYADERIVRTMTEAQRLRDDVMAGTVAAAAADRGAVLVAGFGHARTDYGVPVYLRHRLPGRRLVSVAFVEVIPQLTTPAAYARVLHTDRLPFDYVVFTPRADDTDPCEKFRTGLEKMKAGGAQRPLTAPSP